MHRLGVKVMIHGDDFIAVGTRYEISAFRRHVASRFTVKDKVIGSRPDLGELAETRILNRIVRHTPEGWEYEAGQRHANLIIRVLGLSKAKAARTAGEYEPSWKWQRGTYLWTNVSWQGSGHCPRGPMTWLRAGRTSSTQ